GWLLWQHWTNNDLRRYTKFWRSKRHSRDITSDLRDVIMLGLGGMALGPDKPKYFYYAATGSIASGFVFQVIGIMHNGQSLSLGDYGTPVITTSYPYS